MASVLTIILNWRSAEMSLRSAESALAAMQGVRGAITIVDNASGDGSFEVMEKAVTARGWDQGETPVRVLQSGRNGGFGAGNNVGIRAGLPPGFPGGVRPDYVYILNSDAFPAPDAIRVLRDHLDQNPGTGFAGSFIHGEDGTPHHTAFRYPTALNDFERHIRLGLVSKAMKNSMVAMPPLASVTRVDWLAGASLMMRMDVLEEIGLFDERFFLYYEETDLCLRASRAGWPTDYVPESRVAHIGSVSTGMGRWQRIPGFWLDSRLHYFAKNHGRAYAAAATVFAALGGLIWRARLLVQRGRDRMDPPHYLRDLVAHDMRRGFGMTPMPEGATPEHDLPLWAAMPQSREEEI
ncbi:glycosyltransferase family 2 protein [Xinfangfangia sp. D13-10-4-6]|uniref:glycosyltransferase family 2 protein n=1 Tax=Pseudogemmobacter hezensis TaxID=2737662 RepID=UPI0015536909|nr:glycosyltransferase family 2 protein [Pseudogemmobacter hezensis]NPD13866.1 glycosyltransferase family 2 protein [Pseudogemmobacter hezensis]